MNERTEESAFRWFCHSERMASIKIVKRVYKKGTDLFIGHAKRMLHNRNQRLKFMNSKAWA